MVCSLISLYFDSSQISIQQKQMFKKLSYWSKDMLNFGFLDKGLGIVSQAHFVYDFSTKMFVMLYPIYWPNFIALLPLLLEILGNMRIAIVSYQTFWSSSFFHLTKNHDKNLNILRTELLRWNKKHFSSFLKGFQLSKIVSDLRVRL